MKYIFKNFYIVVDKKDEKREKEERLRKIELNWKIDEEEKIGAG